MAEKRPPPDYDRRRAGELGVADTERDVRGFALKFYTDEGNLDLVGNNCQKS